MIKLSSKESIHDREKPNGGPKTGRDAIPHAREHLYINNFLFYPTLSSECKRHRYLFSW